MRPGICRLAGLTAVLALATAACANNRAPSTLEDSRGAAVTGEAMDALARVDSDLAVPTPHAPELLGFETIRPESDPPLPPLLSELARPTPAPTAAATSPAGAEEAVDQDPTLSPGQVGDSAQNIDSVATEGLGQPDPPAPPQPGLVDVPAYPDPSPLLVTASGRPFSLFGPDAGETTRGVSADTITVGGLVTQTLASNPHRPVVCSGARARFEQSNRNLELTRTIDFVACYDDTGQSAIAQALASTLIRQDVFAIVPLASPAFLGEEMLQAERVLYVGDEALPAFCGRSTPLGFGTHGARGCPVLDARGYLSLVEPVLSAYLAKNASGLDGAVTYATTRGPSGEVTAASRVFEAGLLDHEPPLLLNILPTAADGNPVVWDSVVAALLDTDPEVVFLDGPRLRGLPAALRAAGYQGELILVGAVDPLTVADTEQRWALAPLTVITPGLDLANRSSPGWQVLERGAAAAGISAGEIGLDFVEGYIAADFLIQALKATPEPLTVERVADTLNAGWWYAGIDGVTCGNWWPASHFITSPCVSIAHVEVRSDRLIPEVALVEAEPQLTFNLSGG